MSSSKYIKPIVSVAFGTKRLRVMSSSKYIKQEI